MNTKIPPDQDARGLLKSMAVIGSAQFLSIVVRIVKAKLVAVLLGPSGTGLLAIFANLQMLGSQAAGLGLAQSGVRELAAAHQNIELITRLRFTLLVTLAAQGGIVMALIWLLREQLSVWLLGDIKHTKEVALVGVAVLLFLLASSQRTVLQGLHKMKALGHAIVLGTLAGALAGSLAIWLMGYDGLIWFLLAEPLGALGVGLIYIYRLHLPKTERLTIEEVWHYWKPMAQLGAALMLGGLMTTATLLVTRTFITRDLGLGAAGEFAAAWTITMVYGGFMLNAMQTDYFPRLSKKMHDFTAATRLINTQTQLTIALSGPVFILMIGLAPWIMKLLYTAEFDKAARLLQWQMLGSLFKVTAWSIGQALPAAGHSKLYLLRQIPLNLTLISILWFALPTFGLAAAGMAFWIAYSIHLVIVAAFARRWHKFKWEKMSLLAFFVHAFLSSTVFLVALVDPEFAAVLSIALFIVTIVLGLRVVAIQVGTGGRLISRIEIFYNKIGWPL